MEVRSIFKNKTHFDLYIESQLEIKAKFDKELQSGEISIDNANWATSIHISGLIRLLISKYSRGDTLGEIEVIYLNIISLIDKYWVREIVNFKMGRDQKIFNQLSLRFHSEMLQILSIGVLLDVEKKYFESFIKKLQELKVSNRLFDFLIQYKITEHKITEDSYCPTAFNKLEKFVFELDIDDKKAFKYLNSWYNGLNQNYFVWKDNHITKGFFGYWNFELASILKVKNIEATKCYTNIYFPTDLYKRTNNITSYEIPSGYKLLFAIDELISLCGGKRRSSNQILNGRKIILGRKKKSYPDLQQIINEYISKVKEKYLYQLDEQEFQKIAQKIYKELEDFKRDVKQ